MAELPTSEAIAALPEDDLLASIEATKRRIAELGSLLDAYLDDLTRRADAGDLDPQFSHNDWSFSLSPGRRTWDYPSRVRDLQAQANAAKKAAEADGSAVAKIGAPFWSIRGPQP